MKKIKNKTSHERVPMCLGGLACLANEERGIPHVPCLLYFFLQWRVYAGSIYFYDAI